MKNICITYSGGSYGTFLEWAMYRFSELYQSRDLIVPDLPFNDNGSSHLFAGNFLPFGHSFDSALLSYIHSNENHPIVRMHPTLHKDDNLIDNLEYISKNFKKVIHLTPTFDSVAWSINNKFEKVWDDGWLANHEKIFQHNLKGWNKSSLADMVPWELREFLSFFIYPQHVSENEYDRLPELAERLHNIKIVPIIELRDNLKGTFLSLLDYCELAPANLDMFEEVHTAWMQKQYHRNKDSIIKQIVDSVLLDTNHDWEELTLVDEALVQYYLRENGLEIECNDLNKFPTNSIALREITYRA